MRNKWACVYRGGGVGGREREREREREKERKREGDVRKRD